MNAASGVYLNPVQAMKIWKYCAYGELFSGEGLLGEEGTIEFPASDEESFADSVSPEDLRRGKLAFCPRIRHK